MGSIRRERVIGLGALVVAVAGCSSSGHPPASATQTALKSAVYDYAHNALDGNGEKAWSEITDRCQRQIGHDSYLATASDLTSLYKGLAITSYTVDSFSPPNARVSYSTAVKSVSRSHQLWTFENGRWRWNGC